MTAKKTKLKELILKAQGGDKDALNQVIERFKPTLL
ncbi:helix-turn-helix domain-containing protein [Biomaibacter acetigenes]|nr:helix-turn-helix domain-containing protein [Biomaibacter acetigenes]